MEASNELKSLQATSGILLLEHPSPPGNGRVAAADSVRSVGGLELLRPLPLAKSNSRKRNFGMGRLPSVRHYNDQRESTTAALQPTCLVLITDGACFLRPNPEMLGGPLKLQYGAQPLKDLH
jgi:hypothetical protein